MEDGFVLKEDTNCALDQSLNHIEVPIEGSAQSLRIDAVIEFSKLLFETFIFNISSVLPY